MIGLRKQITLLGRIQWILGCSMGLTIVAFAIFGYRPQSKKLYSLDNNIARCHQELSSNRDQGKILAAVALDVDTLKTRLRGFKRLPQQKEIPEFIKEFTPFAQQAQLKKPTIGSRDMIQRGDHLNEVPIQLSFEGDFVNVYSFLRHIEELQRLIRIPSMKIRSQDKSGQVKVDMTMNLYCATE